MFFDVQTAGRTEASLDPNRPTYSVRSNKEATTRCGSKWRPLQGYSYKNIEEDLEKE